MNETKWSIPKEITFVKKPNTVKGKENAAYVVFDNNIEQLMSARSWAGSGYTEFNTHNEGFELEILEAAQSAQSVFPQKGKLSFWTCKITKEGTDLEVTVGINAEMLCELLREKDFHKGKCTEKLMLVKYGNVLGVTSSDMRIYKKATSGMTKKAQIDSSKTRDWEQGFFYENTNKKSVWLGDIHLPISIDYRPESSKIYEVTILDNDIVHLVSDEMEYSRRTYSKDIITLEDYIFDIFDNRYMFQSSCKNKLPARSKTDKHLDISDFSIHTKKYLDERVKKLKKLMNEHDKITWNVYHNWEDIILLFVSMDGRLVKENIDFFKKYLPLTNNVKITDVWTPKIFVVQDDTGFKDFNSYEELWKYVIKRLSEIYK